MKNFRSYHLSVRFYKKCLELKLPYYLKDQLRRASSSVACNLAEGYGRQTFKDRRRFYFQALGSIRECQSLLEMGDIKHPALIDLLDHLAAGVYKLCFYKL